MNLWQGEVSVAGADTEPFAVHMFIIAVKKKINFLSCACQLCSVEASDGACAYDGVCKLFHLFCLLPVNERRNHLPELGLFVAHEAHFDGEDIDVTAHHRREFVFDELQAGCILLRGDYKAFAALQRCEYAFYLFHIAAGELVMVGKEERNNVKKVVEVIKNTLGG